MEDSEESSWQPGDCFKLTAEKNGVGSPGGKIGKSCCALEGWEFIGKARGLSVPPDIVARPQEGRRKDLQKASRGPAFLRSFPQQLEKAEKPVLTELLSQECWSEGSKPSCWGGLRSAGIFAHMDGKFL